MTGYRAVTASGATYECRDGDHRVRGRYFHNAVIRSFRLEDLPSGRIDWVWLNSLPLAEIPVVGEHIYLSASPDSGWRLSTEVVEVEVYD